MLFLVSYNISDHFCDIFPRNYFGYHHFNDLSLSAGSRTNCILLATYTAKGIILWFKRSDLVETMKELKTELQLLLQDHDIKKVFDETFKNFDKYQKIHADVIFITGFMFGIAQIIQLIISGA